jgi:hypothetical protein
MYEMYTRTGDKACQTQVNKITKFIEKGKGVTPSKINEMYDKALEAISVKHREVHDTEPRWHIWSLIKKALDDNYFDVSRFPY